jgi:hypothetical protein
MTKKSLKRLRARIQSLNKAQDVAYDSFCKKNRIRKGSVADDYLFDYTFNKNSTPNIYQVLKEEGLEVKD